MARITIDVDLTPEVEITGYQRYQDGHGLEVRWPLPARCRCEKCGHDDVAHIEFKPSPQAIRDQPVGAALFLDFQAPFHRCARCNYRQHIIPPFSARTVCGMVVGVILLDLGAQSAHVSNQSRIYAIRPEARSRMNTAYMVAYFVGGAGLLRWGVGLGPGGLGRGLPGGPGHDRSGPDRLRRHGGGATVGRPDFDRRPVNGVGPLEHP